MDLCAYFIYCVQMQLTRKDSQFVKVGLSVKLKACLYLVKMKSHFDKAVRYLTFCGPMVHILCCCLPVILLT